MRMTELFDPAAFKLAALTSSAISGAASVATVDLTSGVLGVPLSVFLAGFAGALVSLSFLPPPPADQDKKKTAIGMAGHVFCGTLLAAFGQPIVLALLKRYLELDLASSAGLGVAGVLGAMLMALLPIGLKYLRAKFGGAT